MTDLQSLRDVAEKATPGPWVQGMIGERLIDEVDTSYTFGFIKIDNSDDGRDGVADAAFIAACDPQTVLSLLDRIRDLEVENRHLLPVSHELRNADLRDMQKRLDAAERVIAVVSEHGFGHQMVDTGDFEAHHHPLCHGCKEEAALAEYREMSKP